MNRIENLFLLFISFVVEVLLTKELLATVEFLPYLLASIVVAVIAIFLPVRLIIYGGSKMRARIRGKRVKKVKVEGQQDG